MLGVDDVLKFGASEGTCFVWLLGDEYWVMMKCSPKRRYSA